MNSYELYLFAGKILSLGYVKDNHSLVEQTLSSGAVKWEQFVNIASNNLVLPAVYLQLENSGLKGLLPEDLDDYLREVFRMNRERNHRLIEQAAHVSKVLTGMDFLFMKGMGNLLDGLYSDVGERMIYDIDILVKKEQMLEAAALFLENGFYTQKPFMQGSLESTIHYPILLREDFDAGVEIHRSPVQYLYQPYFDTGRMLGNSRPAHMYEGFRVPDTGDRIIHNFIHAQLMHNAHYHAGVSLRDLYDLFLLGQKENLQDIFIDFGAYQHKAVSYQKLMYHSLGLEVPDTLAQVKGGESLQWRHKKTLQMSKSSRKRYYLVFLLLEKYLVLPLRFFWNKNARNYIISRLTNTQWYGRHFRAMKKRMGF
jgi:hypothetical protein